MSSRPQMLTKGQKREVVIVLYKHGGLWLAILMSITGLGLWQIWTNVTKQVESLIAKQFEEPKIQQTVERVAAEKATVLMSEQIGPEVTKFKAEVTAQLEELYSLVTKTREVAAESQKYQQSMRAVSQALQHSLEETENIRNQLTSFKSEIVQMQKQVATIQFYQIKGRFSVPNPYEKEMLNALNKLVAIAIPDPAERSKFITELQGPQEPRKK